MIGALLALLSYLLYTANPILTKLLVPAWQMPYGTVIAWLALILFPLLAYLFVKQTDAMLTEMFLLVVGRLVRIALILGCFWGTIAFFLAENWHFSFGPHLSNQDARVQAFWLISTIIPILTLVSLLATAIAIGVYAAKHKGR